MTGDVLAAAADLLGRTVGLRLDAATRGRLARCLVELAGDTPVDAYVARLEADPAALQELLNRITVQETSFFRDQAQFDALTVEVLPTLSDPIRIWSAGCANGQEPYSLAMALHESGRDDWTIVASDISTDALARARAARYSERELRGLSADRRSRYLVALDNGEWEIAPWLRERVTFSRTNIASEIPPYPPGACQVIFCRNVLIYFRREEITSFLERASVWLPRDGYLFLGYSESLWQVTELFAAQHLGEAFVYRPQAAVKGTRARRWSVDPAPVAVPLKRAPRPKIASDAQVKRLDRTLKLDPAPVPDRAAVLAGGEAAASTGDHDTAIAAFRKAVYLDPDEPIAHLFLALSLEASGDLRAARRSYAAARAALDRGDTAVVEARLEGYHIDELAALLDAKASPR